MIVPNILPPYAPTSVGAYFYAKNSRFLEKTLDKPHNVRYNISKLRGKLNRKELTPMLRAKKIIIMLTLIIKLRITKVNKNG